MTRHSSGPLSRVTLVAAAAALTTLLAACGSNASTGSGQTPSSGPPCSDIYRLLGLGPSPSTDVGKCVAQHLTVTGEIKGKVDYALVQQPCARPARSQPEPAAQLEVALNNLHYTLAIQSDASYNRAPVTQVIQPKPGQTGVDLSYRAQSRPDVFRWQATDGSLSVNADGLSGTVDANVAREGGKAPTHIKGDWRCGEAKRFKVDPALASTPCGPLYFLAQLTTNDIERIKGEHGCNTEDLTLSGSVAGHVTEGVTDEGSGQSVFTAPKQSCGYRTKDIYYSHPEQEHYQSNVHFLVDDEVFTLHISQFPYAPGTYNAFTQIPTGGRLSDPFPAVVLYDDRPQEFLQETPGRLTSWSSKTGTFTLADAHSGTIDMDLEGGVSGSDKVHISGSWRCAAA
jgi:hypothetical protein